MKRGEGTLPPMTFPGQQINPAVQGGQIVSDLHLHTVEADREAHRRRQLQLGLLIVVLLALQVLIADEVVVFLESLCQ